MSGCCITAEDFLRFISLGSPKWKNEGLKFIEEHGFKMNIRELLDRVTKIENRYVTADMIYRIRQTIETWQRGCEIKISVLMQSIQELEKAYKTDAQVAKDIIFEGSRRNEKIREIKSDCDIHCGAIVCLESKVKELEDKIINLEKHIHETRIQLMARLIL